MSTLEQRAKLFGSIVKNPLWDKVFEEMKLDLFRDFCAYPNERERIAMAHDMLDDLNSKIKAYVIDDENFSITEVGDNDVN